MTSDRGNNGGADMQFASLPVTPKSAGLNPNANVFHCKVPPTPPESTSEWPLSPEDTDLVTTAEALPYVNGDANPSTPQKVTPPPVSFPPTPESPPLTPVADYSTLNGGVSPPADPPASATVTNTVTNSTEHAEENGVNINDNGITHDQLKSMLKTQLEYYFSRENLASDTYLVSQMDADQYVAILTVANFNQVKKLTNSLELVVEVLRESPNVQVDEKGERVRPLHKRCVVILREIPEVTPVEDIENLFSGVNCPRFISCEFAHNNNWYVTFPTDEDAQRAYQYLREEVRTFQGKPIMARIKAKPLLRSSFMPKNGFKQQYEQPAHTYTPQQRYAPFTPVPTTQYVISQQNYPFFPPSTVVQPWPANPMPFFDPGTVSTTLPPSAFAANGYTAAATYKMPATTGRHGYQNTRNRGPNKPHRNNQDRDRDRDRERDRMGSDNRMSHERHMPGSAMSRSGSRGGDNSHVTASRRDNSHGVSHLTSSHQGPQLGHHAPSHATSHNSSHVHPANTHSHPAHTVSSTPVASATGLGSTSSPSTIEVHSHGSSAAPPPLMRPQEQTSKDQTSQSQKKIPYRSRRRKDDDSSKSVRPPANNSSSGSTAPKEQVKATGHTPKFDLEANAFPPLPGAGTSQPQPKASSQSGDIFENKMSDVVKGTAKAMTRDAKPTTPPSSVPPSSSTGSLSTTTAGVASVSTASAPSGKASPVPALAAASPTSSCVVTTATVSSSSAASLVVSSSSVVNSSCTSTEASPPLSPQKVSRATSTDKPEPAPSSQTAAQLQAQAKLEESFPGAPKLSYAQMVQRTKDREAREAAAAAAAGGSDKATRTEEPAAPKEAPAAANGTAPTATKPQALREQPQPAMPRSGQRTPTEPVRKDKDFKEDPRDARLPRQLKENRERRDRFPRYRDRRRDREPESRSVTK